MNSTEPQSVKTGGKDEITINNIMVFFLVKIVSMGNENNTQWWCRKCICEVNMSIYIRAFVGIIVAKFVSRIFTGLGMVY